MVERGSHCDAQVSLQPLGLSDLPVSAPGVPRAAAVCHRVGSISVCFDSLSMGFPFHHLPVSWRS